MARQQITLYLSLPPTRQDLTQDQWPEGWLLWEFRWGKVGLKPSWSSAYFVQCGPDEPRWSWTQIWVQARTLDYSLNWTAKSSAIQGWRRCQYCSPPTRRWPNRNWGPFGPKSTMEQKPFGTNVRQQITYLSLSPTRQDLTQGQWLEGRL